MNIGIFSKFDMAGGSEFRCAELANGISEHSDHNAFLLCEKNLPKDVKSYINKKVKVYPNIFLPKPKNIEKLYEMDRIIVVNTDCKDFTTSDYWKGKSPRHGNGIMLEQIRKMVFLFNFIVSPSRHLYSIEKYGVDVGIITTNKKFFDEISNDTRYERVRCIPRMILESPIDPNRYSIDKTMSDKIRFGMHSKSLGNKWNDEWEELIKKCNERMEDKIQFDFMGSKEGFCKSLSKFKNVICRKENEIPVRYYLAGIDVFTFFPSWSREEPWARVVGEAMMSGCPIIATKKGGNLDQVVHGNNGFLCKSLNDFYTNIVYLVEHPQIRIKMGTNSRRLARNFETKNIIQRLLLFLES